MLGSGLLGVLGLRGRPGKKGKRGRADAVEAQPEAAAKPWGEADKLADEIRAWFGKDNLLKEAAPGRRARVAWAIESPGVSVAPRVYRPRRLVQPVADTGSSRPTSTRPPPP